MTSQGTCQVTYPLVSTSRSEVDIEALVIEHSAALYKVAYTVVRDPSEARDVVQEIFIRVLRHGSKINQIEDIRVWLIRVAYFFTGQG